MLLRISSSPALAVPLSDVIQALRETPGEVDLRVESLIRAQTSRYEDFTGRVLASVEFEFRTSGWNFPIVLPVTPITSIQSVVYLDQDGEEQTLPESEWYFCEGTSQWLIGPTDEFTSPRLTSRPYPVRVRFTAGPAANANLDAEGIEADRTHVTMMVQRVYDTDKAMTDEEMRHMFGHRRIFR